MSKTKINFICELINNENIVVDIGSDHAKLSKILIDKNKAKKVINIENKEKPLLNSINSTKKEKYFNKIWNIKSDGVKEISLTFFIDTCVIAGMGGKNICSILENAKKHKIKKFIIQPNNNIELLRKWCKKNFFKIVNEYFVKEKKIIYEILIISKNNGYYPFKKKNIIFGKINLKNKNTLFYEKWNNELLFLEKNKIVSKKNKKLIKRIKRVLNEN